MVQAQATTQATVSLVVFPIFAKDVLGEGVQAFGFLASAIAGGLLLGNVVVGGVDDRLSLCRTSLSVCLPCRLRWWAWVLRVL